MKKTVLTDEDILHLAKLANLKLTEMEIKNFGEQLSSVLEYVEQLNEVDTDKVDETASVTGLKNIFREDLVNSGQMIKSPEKKYFKAKRIMQ